MWTSLFVWCIAQNMPEHDIKDHTNLQSKCTWIAVGLFSMDDTIVIPMVSCFTVSKYKYMEVYVIFY